MLCKGLVSLPAQNCARLGRAPLVSVPVSFASVLDCSQPSPRDVLSVTDQGAAPGKTFSRRPAKRVDPTVGPRLSWSAVCLSFCLTMALPRRGSDRTSPEAPTRRRRLCDSHKLP